MLNLTSKKLFKFYLEAASVIAVAMIPVAVSVAPWYHAATTPIQLELEAPPDTQVDLCWDEAGQECLPLVAYANPGEKKASLWLGELPPRPIYQLDLVFRSLVDNIALRGLTLLNTRQLRAPVYKRVADSSTEWLVPEGIHVQYLDHAFHLTTKTGGRLHLSEAIAPAQSQTWLTAAIVWLLLVGILLVIGALGLPLLRLDGNTNPLSPVRFPNNPQLLWIAFGLATIVHILLVVNSSIIYVTDSPSYLTKAISLAKRGTYDTGGYQYELNRLPGYALLLAAFLKFFGYHLTTAAMLQGAVWGIAVLALALSLRRWVHPFVGATGILIAILSPVQVWSSRSILSESAFATFATLSLAAFVEHAGTKGVRSKVWLMIYASLAAFTTFVRLNGIVLFVAIIPVYLPKVLDLFLREATIFDKARSFIRFSLPYVLAVAVLVIAIIGWSVRNYFNRDYFGPSDMTGTSRVAGLMESGSFDANSFFSIEYPQELNKSILARIDDKSSAEPGLCLYNRYIMDKYHGNYRYHGWVLRAAIYTALSENDHKPTNKSISLLDDMLNQIASVSASLSPWQVQLASFLRVVWWAVALPDELSFARDGFREEVAIVPYTVSLSHSLAIQKLLDTQTASLTRVIYDVRTGGNLLIASFSVIAKWYYKGYFILLLVALLSSLYVLWCHQPVLGLPFLIFAANIILNSYLLNVFSRYIQILDVFLIFQCVIGISLLVGELKR